MVNVGKIAYDAYKNSLEGFLSLPKYEILSEESKKAWDSVATKLGEFFHN